MVSFCIGIPNTPWIPERRVSLGHLWEALDLDDDDKVFKVFDEKEPNWSWSQKLWGWATTTECTHLLQIQDDVKVGPEFWPTLQAMVEARPFDVIGLESVLPAGETWYSTADGLIGVAYVFPVPLIREFLTWRATELRGEGYKFLNEDQVLGLWCFVTGRQILHPSTTIIDHDTSLSSTYGNDRHPHRRPARTSVRGDPLPASWNGFVIHVGRFYQDTPGLARKWVKGYGWHRMFEALNS